MTTQNQYHRHASNPPRSTLKDRLIEAYIRWDDYAPDQSEKVAKIVGFVSGGVFMLFVYSLLY
jgi:hypothetical protein